MITEIDYQVTKYNGDIDFITSNEPFLNRKMADVWIRALYPNAKKIEFLASIEISHETFNKQRPTNRNH